MGLMTEAEYKRLLYRLLQNSLIEIRSLTENESPNKPIYALSSLVHNLPMVLFAADDDVDRFYEETYVKLIGRAESLGVADWVRSVAE